MHAARPSSAKCVLRGGRDTKLNSTHSLTACIGWKCLQAPVDSSVNGFSGEWTVKLAIISCEYAFDWTVDFLIILRLQINFMSEKG